jgi:hypothetical protein
MTTRSSRAALAGALVALIAALAASPAAGGRRGYSFTATGHAPRAGKPWTMTVRGRSGRVAIDVVFGGQVVGHIAKGTLRHGRYRHTMRWEKRGIGYPFTVRATITGAGAPVKLDYAVKVRA